MEITFSNKTIAAFVVTGLLCILIPTAAVVVFKLKNREVKLRYCFIGAAAFVVFALILEQILHMFMLPIAQKNAVFYVVYGALAAGVFEETGRFVAFKLFFKNENDPKASIMYGLGHGGAEAVLLAGLTMLSYALLAISINSVVSDTVFSSATEEQRALLAAQLSQLTEFAMGAGLLTVFERIAAIILHTSLSVAVFAGAKKNLLFYPLAIAVHALFDVPAAMFQVGIITNAYLCEGLLAVMDVFAVIFAAKVYKSLKEHRE